MIKYILTSFDIELVLQEIIHDDLHAIVELAHLLYTIHLSDFTSAFTLWTMLFLLPRPYAALKLGEYGFNLSVGGGLLFIATAHIEAPLV